MENGIRGHHLGYLLQVDRAHMQYEQAGYSPHETRSRAASDVRDWMNGILWDMQSGFAMDPVNEDYYRDVIGDERSNIYPVARSFATALLGLYHLSDEEIAVHSEKDGICRACVIGAHCEEETYEYDMPYMRDVIRIANRMDIPYEWIDGVLRISAGDLKRVLRQMNTAEISFANDTDRF